MDLSSFRCVQKRPTPLYLQPSQRLPSVLRLRVQRLKLRADGLCLNGSGIETEVEVDPGIVTGGTNDDEALACEAARDLGLSLLWL